MGRKVQGTLVVIGGAEDKEEDCLILRRFLELSGGPEARIVVVTTATVQPVASGGTYARLFDGFGAQKVSVCDVQDRRDAAMPTYVQQIREATGVFFCGGDQLRITSILGGTPLEEALLSRYREGAVVAGTSAGASAMSDLMIVEGKDDETPKKCTLKMAPGLGLLEETVVDQHFAQRGRIGRLMLAVSQNPYVLGIGLDENTAMVVRPDARLEVIGSQTATVLDARGVIHTNVSELEPDQSLAVIGATIHVLPQGYGFDLKTRSVVTPV